MEALVMKAFGKLLVAAMGALSLAAVGSATVLAHDDHRILQFDSMTVVTGGAVGSMNDRGLTGGGLPWVIGTGNGSVTRDGHVQVSVTGLVIPSKGNINPLGSFKAIVSCVTQHHVIVNVSTAAFPANGAGDSTISDTIALPRHCSHPILFVTSPGGAWFAMSNRGDDEEDDD
jgi:hypothetical protein